MVQNTAIILKDHYDLGKLLEVEELHGGFCNRSFVICIQKHHGQIKYLLRRYNMKTEEKEIRFEHALLSHLKENGLNIVAGVIPTKTGNTYIKIVQGTAIDEFWAVFEYLEGEDRYTWVDTPIPDADMISAAHVLAQLHLAGYNFRQPRGAGRVQPQIMEFLPTFQTVYAEFNRITGETNCHRHFLKHRETILKKIDEALIPAAERSLMPHLPIHCDFHQGNLKYRDAQVVGIFDFDWSKIDLRLFDLALALVYFCATWEDRQPDRLNLDKCNLFFHAYNTALAVEKGPGPLSELEKSHFPKMLAAANLFVLHWSIVDFYTLDHPDDKEYIKYLKHGTQLIDAIEEQADRIIDMINQPRT